MFINVNSKCTATEIPKIKWTIVAGICLCDAYLDYASLAQHHANGKLLKSTLNQSSEENLNDF